MSNSSDPEEPGQDKLGFMESLKGIRKLEQSRVDLYQSRPRKKHRIDTRQAAEPSGSSIHSVSSNRPLSTTDSWFHHGIQKKLQRKIKMGQLTIDAILDLHGHRQREATRQLESFMQYAINTHSRLLLIIHGKGFNSQSEAVLRPLVQHWLSEQSIVLAYCPAHIKDGGSGASYVYLKTSR